MLVRREDWPERLVGAIGAAAETPFAWGRFDCLLWAADAIRAMTDVDLAAGFRGTYDDADGATRTLRAFAGGGLAAACDRIAAEHGLAPVPWRLAQRGDALLLRAPGSDEDGLGICGGPRAAAVSAAQGFGFVPMAWCVAAWRI